MHIGEDNINGRINIMHPPILWKVFILNKTVNHVDEAEIRVVGGFRLIVIGLIHVGAMSARVGGGFVAIMGEGSMFKKGKIFLISNVMTRC